MLKKFRLWLIHRLGGVDRGECQKALDTIGALGAKERHMMDVMSRMRKNMRDAYFEFC